MPTTSGRIFVAIAVSKPGGGLAPLPGAITAAERMAAWAEGQGYNTLLLHDGSRPEITVELLREKITQAINEVTDHTELKRLVIYFAGHGAALAFGDQYWILTNWKQDKNQAIKVYDLQRMLEFYGPCQVSMIGDACQEFSSKFSSLVGSPVLFEPNEEPRSFELDQFFAVDTGMQAFMIKAQGDQKDFCLFTEVLLDALEGDAQGDFFDGEGADRRVTSQSLARYLVRTVVLEASKYGVRMIPRPRPGFYTDATYLILAGNPTPAVPPPAPPMDGRGGGLRLASPSVFAFDHLRRSRARTFLPAKDRKAKARLNQKSQALDQAREASRAAFSAQVGSASVADHFETGCGLCICGAEVLSVQAASAEVSPVDGQPGWYRIELHGPFADSEGWSDVLVVLADGRVVPVCVIYGFVAALQILDAGAMSLLHRPIGANEEQGRQAIETLAQAHAGLLDLQSIIDNAAMLREGKHRIITLGCIAAQLYDGLRDVASLRSLAAWYAQQRLPVPLDIILYGGGTLDEVDGQLVADIAPVAAREAHSEQERAQRFTDQASAGFSHYPIAGRIPWMHQAWSAVATVRCEPCAAKWRQQLLDARQYLAPGLFSMLEPGAEPALVELAGIGALQALASPMPSH